MTPHSAPPVDGKANAECVRFLADVAGAPRSQVRILKGTSNRMCIARRNREADVAQRSFAASTGITVVRRWFGCGFAAPWGRPSLLVVCRARQGRKTSVSH